MPGAEIWLAAFWELSTDRQIGMAEGPIPAAAIDRHTRGWPDDEAETFRVCIRMMDQAYRSRDEVEIPDDGEADPARKSFRAAML